MAEQSVLVMRHAQHDRGIVGLQGRADVVGVAGRLAEWLDARAIANGPDRLTVEAECSATPEAVATTRMLITATNARLHGDGTATVRSAPAPEPTLDAALNDTVGLGPYEPSADSFDEIRRWVTSSESNACLRLLVGNDPFVSQLVHDLTGDDLGLARGELACLIRRVDGAGPGHRRWHTAWTIVPDDPTEPIRSKIRSKMTAATGLGAFVTALLGFVLRDALRTDPDPFDWLAFVALALSAAFYFSALFLYDSLLMPDRFWGSRRSPAEPATRPTARLAHRIRYGRPGLLRPPSSTARVLQQAMVRIWGRIFTPATGALGVGIALLAVGAVGVGPDDAYRPGWEGLVTGGWLIVLSTGWVLANRPQLGTSD